jgi:hypothetical protein
MHSLVRNRYVPCSCALVHFCVLEHLCVFVHFCVLEHLCALVCTCVCLCACKLEFILSATLHETK